MPNHIVVKKDGKFEIVPSVADKARAMSATDRVKSKQKLTDEEIRAIIERILVRVEELERKSY